MNEEYLIGLFRKALIEAKAERMVAMGVQVLQADAPMVLHSVQAVERYENLLRDEKTLRRIAKSVIEAAK